MTKLEYAKEFMKNAISVIPIYHRNKKPDTSLIGGTWQQYCTTPNTECELVSWLASGWNNYGVVAGWNNLVVIDFDNIEYYAMWNLWSESNDTQYVVGAAFKVRTSRGIHVYVTTAAPACNDKRAGIDVQAQRKFVVGPGSIHPSGAVYEPIGAMVFPQVENIESILPLDLFPRVAHEHVIGSMPITEITPHNTECLAYDPYQAAMFSDHLDLISRVKQSVRIESMFPDARKTSSDGRWLSCLCPFHNDTNPSFWIDTKRQICGCAVCLMKPMDALNLYARMHNISDSDAVKTLANELGVWR